MKQRNLKKPFLVLTFIIFSFGCVSAQKTVIKGTVTDTNDQLMIGVNVLEKGTSNGTITDFDGNYQISVKNGDVLQFSYIGYVTQTITIVDQKSLNVVMAEDASQLDEVVVVGYGTQKKSHLTGSISKVVNDDLGQKNR